MTLLGFVLCCTLVFCNQLVAISANTRSRKDSQELQSTTWATEITADDLPSYITSIDFSSYYLVSRADPILCLTQVEDRVIMVHRIRPTLPSQLWNLKRNGNLYELINSASKLGLKSVDGTVAVDPSGQGDIWRVFATVERFAQILHDPSAHALTWNQTTEEVTTQLWIADSSQYWKLVSPLPLLQSELYGGLGGEEFDDGLHDDIIQVTLRYSNLPNPRVYLLQATYASNEIQIEGPAHGSSSQGTLNATFSLSPKREFIYKVCGTIGPCLTPSGCSVVSGITFHVVDTVDGSTSTRGPYGLSRAITEHYTRFESEVGKVVGFRGRATSYVNAIGVDYFVLNPPLLHKTSSSTKPQVI